MQSIAFFPSVDLKETGKRIVSLRKSRGLSVQDLQALFSFETPQSIYKWQQGKTLPSVENLMALAKILGVQVEDIVVLYGTETELRPYGSEAPPYILLKLNLLR